MKYKDELKKYLKANLIVLGKEEAMRMPIN